MNRADLQRRLQRAEDMVQRLKENIVFLRRSTVCSAVRPVEVCRPPDQFSSGWAPD
jgi:hypothetical protein